MSVRQLTSALVRRTFGGMTHRDDEPKRNPAWRAALWSVLLLLAGVALLLAVWVMLLGKSGLGESLAAVSALSSLAAFFVGRRIVRS